MPVKRRNVKRRFDPTAELSAWATAFECEFDFFGDLDDIGIDDSEVGRAMPEAWRRLGVAFMAQWQPTPARSLPWAFEQFGDPACQ
jgi:hypothetical protein